jgi:hypothetical protein
MSIKKKDGARLERRRKETNDELDDNEEEREEEKKKKEAKEVHLLSSYREQWPFLVTIVNRFSSIAALGILLLSNFFFQKKKEQD